MNVSSATSPQFVQPLTGKTFGLDKAIWCSPDKTPLMVSTLPGITRNDLDSGTRSIWRYAKSLPLKIDRPICLGEGGTPLVSGQFEGANYRFKLEWFSPTGSFKDRGASVLMSYIRHLGITSVVEDSSGNGGAAIAAYGAAAGMNVEILVPAYTQPSKVAQIRAYGANVTLVPGTRQDTEDAAIALSNHVFYASHNWHPMFLQGTKTLGYEIWEDLGFKAPDNIVIPAAAGSNVLGCHLAFEELQAAGEIDRMPRIFVTQPKNCCPLHYALNPDLLEEHAPSFEPTIAEGTAIRQPIRLSEMIEAVSVTGGTTAVLSENEILKAALSLAKQGIYTEPTSAHAAAGASQLLRRGHINPDDETIVILTGSGLKATQFYADHFSKTTTA
ncbi:pyridoxal-5'-phosphate-dependent protein subunit beta [Roseibium algicola]|uniref:Pyridoxal-5'-phosphate-dependent protein subunit beta n=1 Tax=Roseibium algicola TaxID=2857014 RepID=A0ABN4X106_9HYPH|nr:pyridoxal-phosphate dependent enzyme [Roseibium aggregatum]AQQ05335.1 pyridoxal-5'-phosphate-dependent protein subunit beta [Roseibium aggregatum]